MMEFLRASVMRELRIGWLSAGDIVAQLGFYLMIATLFPLAVGPASETLAELAVSVIWIAALLSVAPAFDKLFSADFETGWIDQIYLSKQPLLIYVLAKGMAHILMSGLPLLLMTPIVAGLMGLPAPLLPVLLLSLSLGIIGLNLLGLLAAALTLGARRAGLLGAVLILPLAFPLLIFGVMACEAPQIGMSSAPHLSLLLASVLALLVISLWACVMGLTSALEDR